LKALALIALLSLAGCDPWWIAQGDGPAPQQTPPAVTVQPVTGQVVAFSPAVDPIAAATPVPAATSGPVTQPTPEPTIAPIPSSSTVAAAPVVALAGSSSTSALSNPNTCVSLRQVMITSLGRLLCTLNELYSSTEPLNTPIASQPHTTSAAGSAWAIEVAGGKAGGGPFGPSRPLGYGIPVYVSTNPSDPVVTVGQCTKYGGCSMAGTKVHLNPNAVIQSMPDQHLLLIDLTFHVEVDCWQAMSQSGSQSSGEGNMHAAAITTGVLTCSSGGAYQLGTSGLRGSYANETSGGEGIHFGPAAGTYFVTPNELLRGQINHALALNANCANGQNIYPADNTGVTDTACYGGGSGSPKYGDAFQLNWTSAQIESSSHSIECKAMLTAMATYGAYISDTGDDGSMVDIVSEYAYTSDPGEMGPDPYPQIRADMQAAGDADGGGNWTYCFNGLSASDFNLVELAPPAGS
jgi:hypothetical protein